MDHPAGWHSGHLDAHPSETGEAGRGTGKSHFRNPPSQAQASDPRAATPLLRAPGNRLFRGARGVLLQLPKYLSFGEQSPKPPEGAAPDGAAADPLEPVLCLHLERNEGRCVSKGAPSHCPTGPGDAVAQGYPPPWVAAPLKAESGWARQVLVLEVGGPPPRGPPAPGTPRAASRP